MVPTTILTGTIPAGAGEPRLKISRLTVDGDYPRRRGGTEVGLRPGDSVAKTVAEMAQKTTQWEYTLAKSYMQGVPESVRDRLARSYRGLSSVADDTRRYAQAVLEGRQVANTGPWGC